MISRIPSLFKSDNLTAFVDLSVPGKSNEDLEWAGFVPRIQEYLIVKIPSHFEITMSTIPSPFILPAARQRSHIGFRESNILRV